MRLGPRARARLQKRNAVNAAAEKRADQADMRGFIAALDHMVPLRVKAVGAAEPVGGNPKFGSAKAPRMPQNRIFDAQTKRSVQRANGGLSKGIVEIFPTKDPRRLSVPSYVPVGDPDKVLEPKAVKPPKPAIYVSKVFPQTHPNPAMRGLWRRKVVSD